MKIGEIKITGVKLTRAQRKQIESLLREGKYCDCCYEVNVCHIASVCGRLRDLDYQGFKGELKNLLALDGGGK